MIKITVMKVKTKDILIVLKVLAYIAMIGTSIQCGTQIFSAVMVFFKPESSKSFFGTSINLYEVYQNSPVYYTYIVSFVIALSAMQTHVWYLIIELLSSLNLKNPFSRKVAGLLESTGYQLLGIWVVGIFAAETIKWVSRHNGIDIGSIDKENEYLFIAGIVYIISQVFKRGIEIQEENELTV